MKKITKLLLLPVMVLPLLFASCADDNDSNPTLDLSHVSDGFVLNQPSYSGETYDLVNADNLTLTCSQPNYGGVPYVTRYYVQVALDQNELTDASATPTELATSYTTAKMNIEARELNSTLVDMYQEAHPGENMPEAMPVYIRLRAVIDGGLNPTLGQTYSNIITLPNVKATYQAPDLQLPEELFVVGSSIQNAWNSWKPLAPVYGMAGLFYTMVYVPDGGTFKFGKFEQDWNGYSAISSYDDQAGAGIVQAASDDNIQFNNGGWYTLVFEVELSPNKKNFVYTLHVFKAEAHLQGAVLPNGFDTPVGEATALVAPSDATGKWVSPAFTGSGELRAYIKVPMAGVDWWRTEFTIHDGKLVWRTVDIPKNWAESMGAEYSVSCSAGQKLYVDFNMNTAEVQ